MKNKIAQNYLKQIGLRICENGEYLCFEIFKIKEKWMHVNGKFVTFVFSVVC